MDIEKLNEFLEQSTIFEELAKQTKFDSTRVKWFLHQARNFRRMASGLPEPKVDSHHTQFYWPERVE